MRKRLISLFKEEFKSVLNANGFSHIVESKQFVLPMVIHRIFKGSSLLRILENVCRAIGLTTVLGSPVMLMAERRAKGS